MDNEAWPMPVKASNNKKDGLLFLKSIFFKNNDVDGEAASASQNNSPKPLSILSPIANSVISRCYKSCFSRFLNHVTVFNVWPHGKSLQNQHCFWCWGWIKYILPSIFIFLAVLMLWRRHTNKGRPLEAFKITAPPSRNAVEQLLTLQEAISQVEALIQAGNVILLKVRALLFAALPQARDMTALWLVFTAVGYAFVPLKYLILLVFHEAYSREMFP